jgi:hypothetical protein
VAAAIEKQFGVETQLVEGDRGEWRVLVGDREVAKKSWLGFPSDRKVLTAVGEALKP